MGLGEGDICSISFKEPVVGLTTPLLDYKGPVFGLTRRHFGIEPPTKWNQEPVVGLTRPPNCRLRCTSPHEVVGYLYSFDWSDEESVGHMIVCKDPCSSERRDEVVLDERQEECKNVPIGFVYLCSKDIKLETGFIRSQLFLYS